MIPTIFFVFLTHELMGSLKFKYTQNEMDFIKLNYHDKERGDMKETARNLHGALKVTS